MLAILSSSLASAIVGALIVGFYNLWAKRNEFVNDYYKSVVRRRIEAYEQLEQLIIAIKTTVLDTDKRPYHLVFAKDDDWESAHRLVLNVIAQALWLSEEAFEKTRDLSYLLFRLTPKAGGAIEFGKVNYMTIAELRDRMERILAADMIELHRVRKFLKRKRKAAKGFHQFPPAASEGA